MKTSQKEGVSDRPPTLVTCPDMRHRSSAATVGISSTQLAAIQAGSDTRVAPNPLPHADAMHDVIAITVDVDMTALRFIASAVAPGRTRSAWLRLDKLPRPSSSEPRPAAASGVG